MAVRKEPKERERISGRSSARKYYSDGCTKEPEERERISGHNILLRGTRALGPLRFSPKHHNDGGQPSVSGIDASPYASSALR